MYEKISKGKATDVAVMLSGDKDGKCTSAVIDQHWEVNLLHADDKAVLYVFERLDENEGFILSRIITCGNFVESIAEALMEHINACVDEWLTEGLIPLDSVFDNSQAC